MKVLIFSQASWDNVNAVGNTISNFFEDWTDCTFAHFYTRKQRPDNNVASFYYNLSASDIVKETLKKRKVSKKFEIKDIDNRFKVIEADSAKEKKFINMLHQFKFGKELVYWITERIWLSEKWIDAPFEKFVKEIEPDVFFAFATSVYIIEPLIRYLKNNTKAKIVLFIADDVYHEYKRKSFLRRKYLINDFSKVLLSADKLYGCSEELCIAYKNIFGVNIQPLYKGCMLPQNISEKNNRPLKLVYAGNLFYGREQILEVLAKTLERINKNKNIAQLEIYTTAIISENLRKKLNRGSSSRIMGSRPYDEIKKILCEADVVLHVESFEKKYIKDVRYSFSTKIIDCIQSGSGVLAVGPAGIASIEYLRKIEGVCVVDDLAKLPEILKVLFKEPQKISENALKILKFGKKYHDIDDVRVALKEEFERLIADESSSN